MAVTKPFPGTTRYKAMTQQAFRLNIVSAQISTELSAPQARNGVDKKILIPYWSHSLPVPFNHAQSSMQIESF